METFNLWFVRREECKTVYWSDEYGWMSRTLKKKKARENDKRREENCVDLEWNLNKQGRWIAHNKIKNLIRDIHTPKSVFDLHLVKQRFESVNDVSPHPLNIKRGKKSRSRKKPTINQDETRLKSMRLQQIKRILLLHLKRFHSALI